MKKSLYRSLAKSTIKRHKNLYLPFMINGIFLLIISAICLTIGSEKILSRKFITNISSLAYVVMLIFSTIIILSTYNFIQKKKYEENGLYMVLGMERKHIVKIMFWEILHLAIRVVLIGSILAFILYKISLASYMRMINLETDIFKEGIFQNPFPTIMTGAIFLAIYLLLFLVNVIKIRKLSAIELMREAKAGDKKNSYKGITAILGLIFLGGGYYISLTTTNPMKAITNLFIAVILVIIGTYMAFSVIISTLLNILKRNKKFYYKKENFAAISGLMYRVKNSSRTLAGITILSTSVMVILTSGLSLYLGTNEKIESLSPSDYSIYNSFMEDDNKMVLEDYVGDYLKKNDLKASTDSYSIFSSLACNDQGKLVAFPKETNGVDFSNYDNFANFNLLLIEDHDEFFKDQSIIEVISNGNTEDAKIGKFDKKIEKIDYEDLDFKFAKPMDVIETHYYITNDKDEFSKLKKLMTSENEMSFSSYQEVLQINKENKNKKWDNFDKDIENYLASEKRLEYLSLTSKENEREDAIQVNSSIFFMGILLGIAFLVSTALFIYFKQLSEGFDDIDRFRIMRQVGMTDTEAKSTVRKQIGVVFMLPVIFTIMHTAFATPILGQFLKVVGLANKKIMLISLGVAAIFFVAFYTITFLMTEKVYMNLILDKNK